MTKARSLALVCAGPISRSGISRLRKITGQLGPVKSGSLQRASRAVNALRAGTPTADYHDLEASRTILLNVPDRQLPAIVRELDGSEVTWKHKILLLCDSSLDSSELARLEAKGAAVGSFEAIGGPDDRRYAIEGTGLALREMRALIQQEDIRVVEIRRGAKKQYLAGVTFATTFLKSMISGAVECFRDSGLPLKQAEQVAAILVDKTMRDYLKAGSNGTAVSPEENAGGLAEGLELNNPRLARYFREIAAQAFEYGAELGEPTAASDSNETGPTGKRLNCV
jgi:hypothetical protein